MARGKAKLVEGSIEDRLDQALVADWEQIYVVPPNWCWVQFGCIIKLISGRDAELKDCNDFAKGIPYILGASNIENNSFSVERWIDPPQVVSDQDDILFSVKGTIGKVYMQLEPKINISRQIMAIRPGKALNAMFCYYFMLRISEQLKEAGNGLIPGISRKDILEKPIPLPPLAEQQRIVDRIESLFAKLDEAKEKLQEVVDGFETRKASILHKAFTGELTAQWRKEHGVGIEGWKTAFVGGVSDVIDPQPSHRTPPKQKEGVAYIGLTECNYKTHSIDFKNARKVSDNVYQEHLNRYQVKEGDFIIGKIGTIGKPFKIPAKQDYTLSANIVLIQPNSKKVLPNFLFYQFQTSIIEKQFDAGKKSTTQAAFGIQKVRNIEVSVPTLDEQKIIVQLLENLIVSLRQTFETVEDLLDKIDLIKKSILARAFRGELGTNDPSDESATELLKTIL